MYTASEHAEVQGLNDLSPGEGGSDSDDLVMEADEVRRGRLRSK